MAGLPIVSNSRCPMKLQGLMANPEFLKAQLSNPSTLSTIDSAQPGLLACDREACGYWSVVESNDEKVEAIAGCGLALTPQAINASMFSIDEMVDAADETTSEIAEFKNLIAGVVAIAANKYGIDLNELKQQVQGASEENDEDSDEDEDEDEEESDEDDDGDEEDEQE